MNTTTHPRNTSPVISRLLFTTTLALVALVGPATVYAQAASMTGQHSSSAAASAAVSNKPSMDMGKSMGMHKSMEDMHNKMTTMRMTGNPDIDFAMMMVAHHQGAIDMAQAEIDTGKDPAMIKAAKKIIVAQKKEIAQFETWLKKHPHTMK